MGQQEHRQGVSGRSELLRVSESNTPTGTGLIHTVSWGLERVKDFLLRAVLMNILGEMGGRASPGLSVEEASSLDGLIVGCLSMELGTLNKPLN